MSAGAGERGGERGGRGSGVSRRGGNTGVGCPTSPHLALRWRLQSLNVCAAHRRYSGWARRRGAEGHRQCQDGRSRTVSRGGRPVRRIGGSCARARSPTPGHARVAENGGRNGVSGWRGSREGGGRCAGCRLRKVGCQGVERPGNNSCRTAVRAGGRRGQSFSFRFSLPIKRRCSGLEPPHPPPRRRDRSRNTRHIRAPPTPHIVAADHRTAFRSREKGFEGRR